MRVGIFSVKYSPNLGDGLLSECLEAELRTLGDVETVSIDLAGREDYGRGGLQNRKAALAVLGALPAPVRRALVGGLLGRTVRRELRPAWRRKLEGAQAVILGGGNLLADHDLNFPVKIEGAMAEAALAGLPVAVYGVGVSDNWSPEAERLFRRALGGARLVHAAVRDELSRAAWLKRLSPAGGLPEPRLCRDPAVLAARHFPAPPRVQAGAPTVAIGLTDPVALRYHGGDGSVGAQAMGDWMAALAAACAARGWRVAFFTNGSPEDRDYLARTAPRLLAACPDATVAEPFARPADLAGFIARHDLVMAHRLHACIAAYAYARPHVGFTWDIKLNSFFESVGRSSFVAEAGRRPPEEVAALGERALVEGIDARTYAVATQDARREIAEMLAALRAAAGPGA